MSSTFLLNALQVHRESRERKSRKVATTFRHSCTSCPRSYDVVVTSLVHANERSTRFARFILLITPFNNRPHDLAYQTHKAEFNNVAAPP